MASVLEQTRKPAVSNLQDRGDRSLRLQTLAAGLLPLAAMLVSIATLGLQYCTNDDALLSAVAAGCFGDSVHLVFSNVLLGHLCTALRSVAALNWYYILQLLGIAVSLSALAVLLAKRLGPLAGGLLTAVLLAGFSCSIYHRVQFTVSSFVMICCGMLLLAEGLGRFGAKTWLGLALAFLGSLYRFPCFVAAGGLAAALLLHRFFALDGKGKRNAVLAMLLLFALVFGALILDNAAYSEEPWSSYRAYNEVRAGFSDYAFPALQQALGSDTNPFSYLGIDAASFALLKSWNYYDPVRFPAELLAELAQEASRFASAAGQAPQIGDLLSDFFLPLPHGGVTLLLVLLVSLAFLRLDRRTAAVAATAALFVATVAALTVLYGGRLTPWLLAGLQFTLCCYLLFLLPENGGRIRWFAPAAAVCVALVLAVSHDEHMALVKRLDTVLPRQAEYHQHLQRQQENSENLYLVSVSAYGWTTSPSVFQLDEENFFSNIVFLGGWMSEHPDQTAALEQFGLQRPIVDSVDNPRVYLDKNVAQEAARYAEQQLGVPISIVDAGSHGCQLVSLPQE